MGCELAWPCVTVRGVAVFEYHYLRKLADGRRMITVQGGEGLVRRDDGLAFVADIAWARRLADVLTPAGRPERLTTPVAGARLWLWRERPWRMFEFFAPGGERAGYRIDFTSQLAMTGGVFHQVDLYLDLFVDPAGERHLVEDDEELDEAVTLGLMDAREATTLREECRALVANVVAGRWRAELDAVCAAPFELAAVPVTFAFLDRRHPPGEQGGWIGPE